MKKLVLLSLIASIAVVTANAQKIYIKAGGGYIFNAGSSAYNNADPNGLTSIQPSTNISISADGSTATVKSLYGSLGAGYKIGLAGGYQITKNIAAELAINYFGGNMKTIGEYNSPLSFQKEVAYVRGVDFSPTVVIRANAPRFDPYVRAGMIFSGPGKLWIKTSVDEPNGGGAGTAIAVRAKSEVKSKFSVGALGAGGMMFHINKHFSIYSEAEYKVFSITSKSAKITDYTTSATTNSQTQLVPGQQLADLPEYKKSFIFSKDFQQAANGTEDLNQPRTLPTQKVNLNGFGLNVGIIWKL